MVSLINRDTKAVEVGLARGRPTHFGTLREIQIRAFRYSNIIKQLTYNIFIFFYFRDAIYRFVFEAQMHGTYDGDGFENRGVLKFLISLCIVLACLTIGRTLGLAARKVETQGL